MRNISLSDARPGNRITHPVVNGNGLVLVPAGTLLTDVLIGRLAGLGIGFVVVEGPSEAPRSYDDRVAELDARFAAHADAPLMQELHRIVRAQIPETEV